MKEQQNCSINRPGEISIQRIRIGIAAILLSCIAYPNLFQPLLDDFWKKLQAIEPYRWSSFETIWTVFWYGYFEVRMTNIFMTRPQWRLGQLKIKDNKPVLRVKGMRRPSRRIAEIVTYIAPLLLMDFTMIKKFEGVSLEEILLSGNYDPMNATSTLSSSHYTASFLVPTFHNFTSSSPLQLRRALPTAAPSSRRLALELIGSFLLYDTFFFIFHFAMHRLPLIRTYHIPHHKHDLQINPQVTNQLHIFERSGLVLLANFSLNVLKSHVLTRTIFVPVFVWLLVEIHSGMDLPLGYEKILPRNWGGGAESHALHHRTGAGGYEPFFTWWDRLLATHG